jgi:hypothetical protein
MSYSNNYPKYDAFYKYGDNNSKSSNKTENDGDDIYALISAVSKKYNKADEPVKQTYSNQAKSTQPDVVPKSESKIWSNVPSSQKVTVQTNQSINHIQSNVQPQVDTLADKKTKEIKDDEDEAKKQRHRLHKQRKVEKKNKDQEDDSDIPELIDLKITPDTSTNPKSTYTLQTVQNVVALQTPQVSEVFQVPKQEFVSLTALKEHDVTPTKEIVIDSTQKEFIVETTVEDNEKKIEKKSSSDATKETNQITKQMDKIDNETKLSDTTSECGDDIFTYDDVVLKLNCLAGAKKYQKLSISGGALSNSKTVLDWVPVVGEGTVRYLFGEGRSATHSVIEKIIRSAEYHSKDLVSKITVNDSKRSDYETDLSHLTSGLANAQMGIRNLVITYRDDDEYLAKLDNCRNKLSERFYKNMFLKL